MPAENRRRTLGVEVKNPTVSSLARPGPWRPQFRAGPWTEGGNTNVGDRRRAATVSGVTPFGPVQRGIG